MTTNPPILKSALEASLNLLEEFAATADFLPKLRLAYGQDLELDVMQFSQLISELPRITVLSSTKLHGARGAYAQTTNQIYLSSELLAEGNLDLIVSVLLEEIGHYLDARLNVVDAPGDEGAIFSALVRGESLSATKLEQLQSENDHGVIQVNGEVVTVEMATLTGDAGNNNLTGTSGDDLIEGLGGNDTLEGREGNDQVFGGEGVDYLDGGEGHDSFSEGAEADTIIGGAGHDYLSLYAGDTGLTINFIDTTVETSNGAGGTFKEIEVFYFAGGTGDDNVTATAAHFDASGGAGNDTLIAGAGNNNIKGDEGNDSIQGGAGNDSLYGDAGDDTLEGGEGNDYVWGGEGVDYLDGGEGNDRFRDGAEADTIIGGAGHDRLYLYAGDTGLTINFIDPTVETSNGVGGTFKEIEAFHFRGGTGDDNVTATAASYFDASGGAGNDILIAGAGNNDIEGDEGNDSIQGGAGNDSLYGDAGDDTLEGGEGNDYVWGGEGVDYLDGGEGNDGFHDGAEADTIIGGAGYDRLSLYAGDTGLTINFIDTTVETSNGAGGTFKEIEAFHFRGGTGDDNVTATAASYFNVRGGAGNDTFIAGAGNDYIEGDEGNDSIQGGAGNDRLYGEAGNDTLEGVDGNSLNPGQGERDNLSGGSGGDRFILGTANWIAYDDRNLTSAGTNDYAKITDFNPGDGDIVQLQGSANNYRLEVSGSDTNLYLDKAGSEPDELIAVFRNITTLDLSSSAFEYIAPIQQISFDSDSYSVDENGTISVTILRTGSLFGTVNATLTLTDGTATAPSDYTETPISIEFADGEDSKTVTLPIVNDSDFEDDETLNLALTNLSTGTTLGVYGTATLTILDDDTPVPGVLAFNRATYRVSEDGTPIIAVTVVRTGGSDLEVSATISLSDGTATAGQDYNNQDLTVTFADGETSQTVIIPVLDDTDYEPTETINLTLSNPSNGATLGTQTTAVVEIIDNDAVPGVLAFSQADYSINEDGTPIIAVTVNRTGGSDGAVSATISLSDGTATNPEDYTNNAVTVSFADGETEKTVEIPVADDGVFESDETINLSLVNPTNGATIGTQDTATLTIVDNDGEPGSIAFSGSIYSVNEDGTPIAGVTLVRTGGSNGEVSVTLTPSDGTAVAPDDYTSDAITVTFASGETEKTVSIPVNNDSVFEDTEVVNLTLSNPTNGVTLGTQTTAILNIVDDDAVPGVIEFDNANYTVNEDGTVVAAVTLLRTGGSDGDVSVRVTPSSGSATAGSDYVNNNPIVVNFANGETSKTVTIPIINDTVLEADETINLTLSNPNGGVSIGGQNTAVLTIIDNDFKPKLTVDITANSVNEGDGTLTATITRNTPTDAALEVSLVSSDESEITTPATVTIPVGETAVTVDLTVVDDTLLDPTQSVTLIATASGFNSGSDNISVLNNDTVNLTLNFAQSEIGEDGRVTTATITRDFVNDQPLVVQLSGDDGVILPDTVTIAANQTSATFNVEAVDNADLDGTQTVNITATPLYDGTSLGIVDQAVTATLDIIDDESPSLTVDIDRSLIAETGTATATITRNTDTTDPLTVTLSSSDTTEATVPTTVTIAAGETSVTAIVTGVSDGVSDGSQPVTISASATGLNSGNASLEVSDIEVPDLTVTQLNANSPAYTNQQAQFTYKVENLGLQNLSGTWIDRVYLSTDNKLDNSDELLTEFEITADIPVGQFYERNVSYFNPRTPGEYYLIAVTDEDNQVDEGTGIGETNNTVVTPFTVVPAYSAEVFTDTTVGIAGESLLFQGTARSNEDNSPIPFEFVTIEVENNGFTREFSGFTDADGNFVRSFTPLQDEGGTFNIRAYFPDNVGEDVGYEDSFTVLGAKLDANSANHDIIADTPFTASVQLENLTDTTLTGFTYDVSSLPENWDVQVNLPTQLDGNGSNTVGYTITAPNDSVITQDTFNINLTSAEGVTASLPVTVDLARIVPSLVADTSTITSGMLRGEQTFVEFELTNEGGAVAENIEVLLPNAPWLSLATTDTIASLAAGESTSVTLALTPGSDLALTEYTGNIVFDAAGNDGDLSLPFNFRAVSDATGDLTVNVVNELFYFAEGSPKLSGAEVIVRDYFTQAEVARMTTDDTGMVNFDDLAEGYYSLEVKAEDHSTFRQTVEINAGETESISSFLSLETVKYTWTVTETEIQDQYNITVESVFETDVPIPTVTVDPPSVDLADLQVVGQVTQIDMTFTNHGLIAANDLALNFSSHPFYKIEPLLDEIGSLDAKSSITVPVRITRIADFDTLGTLGGELSLQSTPNVPCNISVGLDYYYDCGPEQIKRAVPIPFFNAEGNCGDPVSSSGSSFGRGGRSSGEPGGVFPVSIQSTPSNCDPCVEKNKQAAVACSLTLIGCVPNPLSTAATVIACLSALGDGELTLGDGGCIPGPVGCAFGVLDCLNSICFGNEEQGNNNLANTLSPSASASGTIEAQLDKIAVYRDYWQSLANFYLLYFGDEIWLQVDEDQQSTAWLNAFGARTQGTTATELQISETERIELLSLDLPPALTGSDINKFIDRWNRTIEYWSQGIQNVADVPNGQSTDFITFNALNNVETEINQALLAIEIEGYTGLTAATQDALSEFQEALESDSSGVCAKVRIQINQEAVMTRSAFLGELIIENTSDTIDLEDITVNLEILDENGNSVNELFGITDPILQNISSVDGNGILNTNSSGSAEWTFIPTRSAAGETPEQYTIGGTLSYIQDGQLVTVPLLSTPITVNPQAELTLDYFQQRNVYGDDPFTDATEVAEPFSLAVLVQNNGFGDARNLSITSAQPEIVDNEKGLLIDFDIIGSQVNGENINPSLTADFGDIAAGETAVGEWLLKSSLQGKFIDYEATFEHINDLGNEELSLIKEVNIHELIQTVQADSDGLSDFLVNDEFDANFYPDTLYFSDGNTAPVTPIDTATVDAPVTILDLEAEISLTPTSGWNYIRLEDPANGQFEIEQILRSDGTVIDLDNIWRTDRTFPATGRPIYENILHFLDFDSTGSYTITYDSNDSAPPEVREIIDVDPNPRDIPIDSLTVVFTEAIRANTFDYQDLTLTLDNGTNLITDTVTISQVDPITFQINNLTSITGNIGQYQLSIDSTGVEDLSGNIGAGTVTENWLFTGDRPAVQAIEGFSSNLLSTAVDQFTVIFTEPIQPNSFDYTDITLTRNEGGNLVNDTITISQLDNLTYQVSNLSQFTDTEGDYELLVTANNIQDTDNNNGVGGKGFTWVLDNTAPTLTDIDDVTSPRNTAISSVEVSFDQAIDPDTFDYQDLTLTVEGGTNLVTAEVEIDKRNETTYTIKGLTFLQDTNGEYTLTVNGAGIEDNAGNTTTNDLSTTWQLDRTDPLLATNIQVSATPTTSQLNTTATSLTTLNEYGQYRVNSPNITVTGDLPEANLRVYLTDATTGESLGQATVTNTSFSADIQLSGVGSRTVELRLVDEAGNDSTGTIDIFADVTQPVILDFLNVPDTATLDPVTYLDVQFSEIIDLNTFDKTDISLLRDGQAVTLPDTVTISQVSGSTYRINGLDTLTTTPGTYSLEVNATTLQDNAGNSGIAAETAIFTIAEPPTPGVTLTATGGNTTVTEGGNTDTYSIILDTQPTADVTVTLTVGAGITTDTNILTFNDSNWNQPQTITVTAVNDTTPEGDHTATITHTTNSSDSNYNNLTLPNINVSISDNDAEIQGMKWHDLDGDGVKDTDEPGLQGWTIYLDSNTNGQLDAGEISVVTDENGNYTFTNLRPDTYTVAEVMQEGWQQTYPQVNVTTTGAEIELYIPNSPIISNETYTTTSATNLINLDDFWADARFTDIKGTGFTSVIIDTGIDLNHPLFGADDDNNGIADKILYQYDFADQDNNASDKNNHGSHIASIFSSIAPDANLIVLKVFSDEGSGFFSDLEAALQWVTTNADAYNVASVNLSLGDNQNWITQTARYGIGDELAALASQNILIAAAAGNSFYQYASTPGLAYPAIDPNVISVGAVWADNFGSRTFTGGAGDYTTDTDRIASFSQRHPELLDTFAPGILITGANATGGTISMGGTSQATPYVTALATLAQEIAQEYLGRKLSVTEFRTLLETTGDLIIDGDDENDNVSNTGASYPRINAIALAEAILNLDGSDSTSTPDHPDNNSTNDPIYIPENTFSLVHTVNLTAGQVATDIDFGNQLIPPILSITPTDAEKEEGDSGTTAYSFTLTRAENTTGETSVTYEVTGSGNNPANADDFGGTFPSDTVTFADGETEKEITVEVTGDSQVEPDENFTLNLTNPSGGAQITNGTATGTILNDDTENTPPQAFYFSTDANTYSPGETLSLTNAWVLDPDGTSDIERVDMWLLAPEGDWRNVEDAEDFEPWSGGNQWASFDEYTLDLSGLESGEYTLWGKAYDSAGNASDAYTTTFEINNTPPQAFYFSTDANTYSPGETLSLTNAWVLDPDGISDIERVDMWLLPPEGDWRNVEDAEDFEPWSGGNQWASFDEYTLDLSGLESGEYTLWGKAYDSAGNASDAYTTTFEVSSVSQSTQTQSNTQTLSQVQQESSSTSSGDELTGMAANDSLVTQQDGDKLTKSDSNDPFVYTSLSESGDVITDFQVADDQIVLTEVLESVDYQGSDALADGYVRLVQGSSATQVQIDPDGLQGQETFSTFITLEDVSAAELSASNFVF